MPPATQPGRFVSSVLPGYSQISRVGLMVEFQIYPQKILFKHFSVTFTITFSFNLQGKVLKFTIKTTTLKLWFGYYIKAEFNLLFFREGGERSIPVKFKRVLYVNPNYFIFFIFYLNQEKVDPGYHNHIIQATVRPICRAYIMSNNSRPIVIVNPVLFFVKYFIEEQVIRERIR